MTQKQPKKQTEKVYRSMTEFKKHFLPEAYKKELEEERRRDSKNLGAGLIKEFLENIKQELRR
ncbi:MAG: hypothetical protein OXI61_07870 [Candidatus Poribacteria bacterium]|nr:hypothetical protein [Candidatus Poribacteria bacterium]